MGTWNLITFEARILIFSGISPQNRYQDLDIRLHCVHGTRVGSRQSWSSFDGQFLEGYEDEYKWSLTTLQSWLRLTELV